MRNLILSLFLSIFFVPGAAIVAQVSNPGRNVNQAELVRNWSLFFEYHKNGEFVTAVPYGWNVYRLDPTRFKPLYTKLAECYYSFYKRAKIGQLKVGTSQDDILKSLGEPSSREENFEYKKQKTTRWLYEAERSSLYFVADALVGWDRENGFENPIAYADTMIMIYDLGLKDVPDRAASLWLSRAFALENYFEGKELEAITSYAKAAELDFDGIEIYYLDRLGVLYAQNVLSNPNFKLKAVELYRKIQAKYPDNPLPVQRLKVLITDPFEFVTIAEQDLANDPQNSEKMWAAVTANRDAELWGGAEKHLRALIKREPKNSTYWTELGKVLQRDQKFRPAIEAYETALKHEPGIKENYLNISTCYRMLGNFAAARSAALKAAQADRTWGRPYMEIAEIYKSAVEKCVMQSKGGDWSKLDLDDKLMYKLAQDNFARAKAVEPLLANEANQRVVELNTLIPAKEDLFFYRSRISNGKISLQSSCYDWVGEAVSVPTL